jgi:hypothetical protein
MSYDLETINQAWYIACEECMEIHSSEISDTAMFTYIVEYCKLHSVELIKEAANELNERRDNELRPC